MVELLVVIALIAALSGLLLGGGRYALESGRISRTRAELAALSAALENYRAARGDFPLSLDLLGWEPATLIDPWGRAYRYAYKSQTPWTNPGFVLWSLGPDGVGSDALRVGGFPNPAIAANADNLYATLP